MKKAFTLAEALITLGIIGVVAAVTIPAVVANVNQQEYKTGLRKAVSTLNSAIQLNIALDGIKPSDYIASLSSETGSHNAKFSEYLQKHMSVIKSTTKIQDGSNNVAFYTSDGIKFETPINAGTFYSHEFKSQFVVQNASPNNPASPPCADYRAYSSYWLWPCGVMVDVNGDKAPNKADVDRFLLLIVNTSQVIPYGVKAQKLMYSDDN